MDNFQDGVTVYLWVNSPCIFIGRNQNPLQETDTEALKRDNVALLRRKSGGGAVYQDTGNLNYTYIVNEADYKEDEIIEQVKSILSAVGATVEKNGRNDLLSDGGKVSGTASYFDENKALLHGTLLVNVDLDKMYEYLKPKRIKLISKGVDSVKSRVKNLGEDRRITVKDIERAFADFYKDYEITYLSEPLSQRAYGKVTDEKYIFGDCPVFDIVYDFRCQGSVCSLSLRVKNGKISEAEVFTDSLKELDFTLLSDSLKGENFSDERIRNIIGELNI